MALGNDSILEALKGVELNAREQKLVRHIAEQLGTDPDPETVRRLAHVVRRERFFDT